VRISKLSELESLIDRLSTGFCTVTLAFNDPLVRLPVFVDLVQRLVQRAQVVYLDFDLQFSSLLYNLDEPQRRIFADSDSLVIVKPSINTLDFIEGIGQLNIRQEGVIVLDSLNSLQSMLAESTSGKESKIANQKTAAIVTFLQLTARFYKKTLIISNISKSRPQSQNLGNSGEWQKTLVGGRMIRLKSELILSANESKQDHSLIDLVVQKTSLSDQKDRNYRIWS
jgi:hypothetical protein